MPSIMDLAQVFRSKNAGPFELTIDLMFDDAATFDRVWDSGVLSAAVVADIYGVDEGNVRIIPVRSIHAIKVSFPRPGPSSGAPGDSDVYGAQQHAPLMALEV